MMITDEEIEKEAQKYDNSLASIAEAMWMPRGFIEGAKWMREKMTALQKKTQNPPEEV